VWLKHLNHDSNTVSPADVAHTCMHVQRRTQTRTEASPATHHMLSNDTAITETIQMTSYNTTSCHMTILQQTHTCTCTRMHARTHTHTNMTQPSSIHLGDNPSTYDTRRNYRSASQQACLCSWHVQLGEVSVFAYQ